MRVITGVGVEISYVFQSRDQKTRMFRIGPRQVSGRLKTIGRIIVLMHG